MIPEAVFMQFAVFPTQCAHFSKQPRLSTMCFAIASAPPSRRSTAQLQEASPFSNLGISKLVEERKVHHCKLIDTQQPLFSNNSAKELVTSFSGQAKSVLTKMKTSNILNDPKNLFSFSCSMFLFTSKCQIVAKPVLQVAISRLNALLKAFQNLLDATIRRFPQM